MASDPHFASLGPSDPDLIGGCCSYEAVEAAPGYDVTIHLGWGDCEAGCISRHDWKFHVDSDGTVALVGENGDTPVEFQPVVGNGPARVSVELRAGPTCPVEGQAGCDPKAVANAEATLYDPDGNELSKATSDEDGEILLNLPPGAYFIVPSPVEGLLGTAEAKAFSVVRGETRMIRLDYDTGIR